jgi:ribosomal protein S18 acetylase RimI-like enzyme
MMTPFSPEIIIRPYRQEDEAAVQEITFKTGFKGEDLTDRDFFDDKRLWFMIFIYYYAHYEPQHFFVAVDTRHDAVVGFIAGTTDTAAQIERFQKTMIWRILLRAFTFTLWRYPRTFKTLLGMTRMMGDAQDREAAAAIRSRYPAHLHINLLPEYQHRGLGTRLMKRCEEHLIGQEVEGVHLQTSNHNRKAVPFYTKMGFAVVHETAVLSHPELDDLKRLTFAKELGAQAASETTCAAFPAVESRTYY